MQSEKIWNNIEFGQSTPKVLDKEARLTNIINLNQNMMEVKIKQINAISMDEFMRIATCSFTKEAWDIL